MRMVIAFFAMGCNQEEAGISLEMRQLYPPRLATYSIVSYEQLQVPDRQELMPFKYRWIGGRIPDEIFTRFGVSAPWLVMITMTDVVEEDIACYILPAPSGRLMTCKFTE